MTRRRITLRSGALVGALALLVTAAPASAQTSWADWFSGTAGSPMIGGELYGGAVDLMYTGPYSFVEAFGSSWYDYAIYDVPTRPADGDMIGLSDAGLHTVTFSAPVVDPFLAIVSLGRSSLPVSYTFGTSDFSVISEGLGAWGDGSFMKSGAVLTGYEGHGVIQFTGTYSEISWSSDPTEYWHGITVGAAAPSSVVPEPASLLLLATGLLGLGAVHRRRRRES